MELINNFSEIFLSVWNKGILGVDIFQILIGIGIFLLFLVFRGLISKLVIKKLEIISKRTTNKLDDTFVQSLVGPARFLPIVLGFFIASYYMTFSMEGREVVDTINRTLITILIFWVIHQIIEPVSYILSGLDKLLTRELIGWIIKSLKILIFILGLAAVLELWGIKIGPIIAGLGLFGVAVALGAQDLFKNLISGILVLVEKRFKIGDWIAVEGIIEGVVEKIGFRSTTIRKFDKSLAIIPNFQFAENAVVNVSETSNWLISWIITLQYDTTVDQLKKIRDEIENHINLSEDYNTSIGVAVRVDKFSDSSIDMYVRCFTKTGSWNNWLDVKERLAIAIKEISQEYYYNVFGITLTFCIINVLILKIISLIGLLKINFNIIFSLTNPFYFLKIYSPLNNEFSFELIYEMIFLFFNQFNFNIIYSFLLLTTFLLALKNIFFKSQNENYKNYLYIVLFSLIVFFLISMNNFRYNVSYNIYILPFLFLSIGILLNTFKKKFYSIMLISLLIINFTLNIENYKKYIYKPSNLDFVCTNKSTRDFYYHWARNFDEDFFKKICLNSNLLFK